MFIAMNRFSVKRGAEEAFEKVWLSRQGGGRITRCRPLHGAHAIGPSALFRLVKQLELPDFCANGLVGRQQARPSRRHSLFFWFSVSPFLLGRVKR